MRPAPQEVIDGVRRVLRDVVEPEISSDHARQRLQEVRAVLAQVDWNDAGLRLASRTAELREVLLAMQAAGLVDPAGTEALGGRLGTTFDELQAQYASCAAVVVSLLRPLEDLARRDEHGAALRDRLRAALR